VSEKLPEFDFELWSRLAKESPETFDAMCTASINEIIEHAAPDRQRRLEGLQWQLDQISQSSATPLSACMKISKLMWEQVTEEDGLQDKVNQLYQPAESMPGVKEKQDAEIIPFPGKNR